MRRHLHQRISSYVLAATAATVLLLTGAAVIASAASGDAADPKDTSKAEAPTNTNPDKDPTLDDDRTEGEHDETDASSRLTSDELAAAEEQAEATAKRAASDASFIPCFTPDGLIAHIVDLDLADPDQEPMSATERDEYCQRNFPGTRGVRS